MHTFLPVLRKCLPPKMKKKNLRSGVVRMKNHQVKSSVCHDRSNSYGEHVRATADGITKVFLRP